MFAYVVPPEALTPVSFFCSFLLVTILFVMFADLIPKRVAMSCPETVAVRCISPMVTLIMLLKPLVWLLTVLANAIMRMMRVPLNNQDQITNEDVIATVEAGAKAGVIAPLEHTAITNMMGLENHLVPSAMTARDSIIYFSLDESDESIREKISLTPHNKFLVVDGDIDHVLVAIRSMAPKVIAVDEIGSGVDFKAIEYAVNSGVSVVATIHGKDLAEAREKLGQDIDKIFKRKIVIKCMGEYVCI